MFNATHYLIIRNRKTPVQLISSEVGFKILTEAEVNQGREPAFELRTKQGFFCQGISVVGYQLEPIDQAMDGVAQLDGIAQSDGVAQVEVILKK